MPLNFDDTIFDTLSDSMDEVFPEIMDVFFHETDSSIESMKVQISANNADEIRGIAHKLKSSAKTFGALGLVEILINIENFELFNEAELNTSHQKLVVEYALVKEHILAK